MRTSALVIQSGLRGEAPGVASVLDGCGPLTRVAPTITTADVLAAGWGGVRGGIVSHELMKDGDCSGY